MTTKKKKERPPPFAKLKQLHCYEEIRERLVAGYPCDDIARFVQEEEGEYLHATRRSLAEALRRFAAKEIAPVEIVAPRLPTYIARATREFGDRLEDLRRLERTYEVVLYRVDLAHGKERRTGDIDQGVDRQIKVLIDLVAQMHAIKMDLGLTGSRDLGSLIVSAERLAEIKDRYGEGAARAFADPVQRAQVLGLLKRVMRLSGRSEEIDIMSVHGDGDTGAVARLDATEGTASGRAADYDSVEDDDDDGFGEAP